MCSVGATYYMAMLVRTQPIGLIPISDTPAEFPEVSPEQLSLLASGLPVFVN